MPSAVTARPAASRPFVGGAVALLVALGLCGLTASSYASATSWVMHSLEVQNKVDAWTTTLLEIQNDTRAYLASGDPVFLEEQPGRLALAPQELAELRQLVADNSLQLSA